MRRFRKRALSFLLTVVLFVGMLPAITVVADAAVVPQSAVDGFVQVAKAAEGKTKSQLGIGGTQWCARFVNYCLNNSQIGSLLGESTDTGAPGPVKFALKRDSGTFSILATDTLIKACKNTYYDDFVSWVGSSKNIKKVDSYKPEPGDLVLFDWNYKYKNKEGKIVEDKPGDYDHIGIMLSETEFIHGNYNFPSGKAKYAQVSNLDEYNGTLYADKKINYRQCVIGYFRFGSSSSSHTVTLDPTYLTLPVGASFDFSKGQAAETTANWKDLSWKSSNSKIASVSGGVVTGKAVGQATVTVSTASGSSDSVTFNIVKPSYNCAERWTITTEDGVGPRVDHNSSAARSARYSTDLYKYNYVSRKGAPCYILSKYTDGNGTQWGFGGGYSSYLDQNIWGWYNLVDKNLGSEQYDYTYMPSKPTVNVQKKNDGVATVSWSAANQATYYNLYQDGVLLQDKIQGTSVDVHMEIGATETFAVEAVNGNFGYNSVFCAARKSSAVSFTMLGCTHDYEVCFEWLNNYSCTAMAECSLCDEDTEGHTETKTCSIVCDNGTIGEMIVTATADFGDRQYSDSQIISGTVNETSASIQLPLQLTDNEMIIVAGYNADGMLVTCRQVTELTGEIHGVEGDSIQILFVNATNFMPLLSKFRLK